MKAFVINMDSRPDRMESFNKNLFPFPIERVSGVIASCGEDGCTLSHMKILSAQKDFPFVVFEDDCVMLEPWSVVEESITQLSGRWDALWLGATLTRPLRWNSTNTYTLKRAFATHAIIYNSKRIVDYIVNNYQVYTPSGQNFDIFLNHVVQEKFNCYITNPICATQKSDYSDIAKVNTNNELEIVARYKKYT